MTRHVLFGIEDGTRLVFGRLMLRQGGQGVPIGGFASAQLVEVRCPWPEATWGFGRSAKDAETTPNTSLTLTGCTNVTTSPECAQTMHFMGRAMRSPEIPMVPVGDLDFVGFRGWGAPIDRLIGTFETAYGNINLGNTLLWDGSANGGWMLLSWRPRAGIRPR